MQAVNIHSINKRYYEAEILTALLMKIPVSLDVKQCQR